VRRAVVVFALALALAPLGARAADLVIWWEQTSEQEDAALRETIAAFERKSGRRVELVFYPQSELPDRTAAIEAGHPPDLAFGLRHMSDFISEWAFEDRLVDVSDTIGSFSNLFDPDALAWWMRVNEKSGQRGLYALPIGRVSNHVHVWTSLLERAGFTVEDIPKRWDAFWSFWCDRVQPAARRATGRDDLWAVGLNMSGEASDTQLQFFQFLAAYDADYVTRDGQLVIDDPAVRRRLVEAIDAYTAVWRKGCTPPGSISWNNDGNNEQFLAAATVMAINPSLSIPNALRRGRPGDHFKNTATIEWPLGRTARLSRSSASSLRRSFSRTAATSPTPRSSSVSSSPRAGSPTTSISRASACCRRCRSCSMRRSGWIRATATGWPR
jgi:multiple sugar transport system substrate-binding protein